MLCFEPQENGPQPKMSEIPTRLAPRCLADAWLTC